MNLSSSSPPCSPTLPEVSLLFADSARLIEIRFLQHSQAYADPSIT